MIGFWIPLAAKALTAAVLVVASSLAAERSGPFWGALIASLPVAAAPAYVFLALQTDAAFIAQSALSSFATNGALALFLMSVVYLAPIAPKSVTIAGAVGVWMGAAFVIHQVPWTALSAFAMMSALFFIGMRLARAHVGLTVLPPPATRHWIDLPLRAGLVGCLVAAVVAMAGVLGPSMTGAAAVFPVVYVSLITVLLIRLGGKAVAATMANAYPPLFGFGVALLVLHLTAQVFGLVLSLSLALATTLGWSLMLILKRRMLL